MATIGKKLVVKEPLTLARAKELSIKKWEWIVKQNGVYNHDKLIHDIPEIKDLVYQCGFCQYSLDMEDPTSGICLMCNKCPLYTSAVKEENRSNIVRNCIPSFDAWSDKTTKLVDASIIPMFDIKEELINAKELAQNVLDDINAVKID